jgi:threonine dehydratase
MTISSTLKTDDANHLSLTSVHEAQRRLQGRVVETPIVRSNELDQVTGAHIWFKTENLQHGGSFKTRGAMLAVDRLVATGSRGIVAHSTGNHAIAVAIAAQRNGLPAVLVLPADAAPAKVKRILAADAEVVWGGASVGERAERADELSADRGFDLVDPYQNPHVVVGQGTATAEMLTQVKEAGSSLDTLVLPVGGGSALAGACLATDDSRVDLAAVEPAAVPALTAALSAGKPVTVAAGATIADGLSPDRVGPLPFEIARTKVTEVLRVKEAEIAEAVCCALEYTRLLIEPAAAAALAGALIIAARGEARNIGVILTGGNARMDLVASLLSQHSKSNARHL